MHTNTNRTPVYIPLLVLAKSGLFAVNANQAVELGLEHKDYLE